MKLFDAPVLYFIQTIEDGPWRYSNMQRSNMQLIPIFIKRTLFTKCIYG